MEDTLIQSSLQAAPVSRTTLWAGRITSGIAALFLAVDSMVKVLKLAPAVDGTTALGFPEATIVPIGIAQLVCLVVYLIPRTSVFGAVLLTGYLGGAVATHVRVGSPLVSHILFPTYVAMLLWGGLFLMDTRLRLLLSPPPPEKGRVG